MVVVCEVCAMVLLMQLECEFAILYVELKSSLYLNHGDERLGGALPVLHLLHGSYNKPLAARIRVSVPLFGSIKSVCSDSTVALHLRWH